MINDFFNLIFPKLCYACNGTLLKHEREICTPCQIHLPKTNFHLDVDNKLNKIFWGRVDVESVAAFYYFNKGNKVQNLLHQLKYKGAKEVGEKIGILYGFELMNSSLFEKVDLIIPVPLHPKKHKKRGYNQSEWFAKGLVSSMQKELCLDVLFRNQFSETQTKKSRFNRWENVAEIFELRNQEKIRDKHILLVDDVITTGATLEACIKVLKSEQCAVSVVTIACA
ncbi:MAG: ComF family protein [Flavobacteriales bacterium]|nr:ComF family protein [Flavobacteriales bacterium]